MRSRSKGKKNSLGQLFSVVGGFMFIGIILILHVWLPIQAQRSLGELKKWEKDISDKKSVWRNLSFKYKEKTSLANLDNWAKANGPWKVPSKKHIVTIYEQ